MRIFRARGLCLKIPKPKIVEITAVVNTKISTAGGLVERPWMRLKVTENKVTEPIKSSKKAKICIPNLGFISILIIASILNKSNIFFVKQIYPGIGIVQFSFLDNVQFMCYILIWKRKMSKLFRIN